MSFEHPGDNERCDHCNKPGKPYEYQGEQFSGLIPFYGERVCPGCADRALANMTLAAPILPLSPSRWR